MMVSSTPKRANLFSVHHPPHHSDPATHSVTILGTLKPPTGSSDTSDDQAQTAIVRIERASLPSFSDGLIATAKLLDSTDIVSSLPMPTINEPSLIVTRP